MNSTCINIYIVLEYIDWNLSLDLKRISTQNVIIMVHIPIFFLTVKISDYNNATNHYLGLIVTQLSI